MSIDDLNKLVIGEEVFLSSKMNNTVSGYDIKGEMVEYSFGEEVPQGIVRGIDTWSNQVRVEFDEYNCHWVAPRIIHRKNNKK